MKAGKVWGETVEVWANHAFEIHRLSIKAGHRCSKHRHLHKFNLFYVESGKLLIRSWKTDYALVDETVLSRGERFIQKPGEWHEFECLEDCICFEVYWTTLEQSDIERENVGGRAG